MNNYAFIDSQNLNLATQDLGWKLNFRKFRVFLGDKYKVKKAFLFVGFVAENEKMYESLKEAGYEVIFKPTLDKGGVVKGNCDAELVLRCMIELKNFDKAVIVSGDGDFYCLVEYLKEKKKLLKIGIPSKYHYSSLLRKFSKDFFYVSDNRGKLEYRKSKPKKAKKPESRKKPAPNSFGDKKAPKKPAPKRGSQKRRR